MSEVKNEVKSSVLTKLDLLKAWFKWCLAVEVPVSFDPVSYTHLTDGC